MRINTSTTQLNRNMPKIDPASGKASQSQAKSLGEAPPIRLSLSQIGSLASLFSPQGVVERLRRKLNYLNKVKCKIVPAKGTTACIDKNNIIYLGVEFLEKFQDDVETLAGVLAHEYGHSLAIKPDQESLNEMNWDQIFEMRKAHETLADEKAGRLLYLMGYSTNGVTDFLLAGKDTHNLKYHPKKMRAQIIENGFADEKRKAQFAQQIFSGETYQSSYHFRLLDIL